MRTRICERCALSDRLEQVLDDGTGAIADHLQPLRTALLAMPKPRAGLAWLNNASATDLLHAVATGTIELSHQALAAWPNRQAAAHPRDLLTCHGILEGRDPALATFESWLHHRMSSLDQHRHRQLLRRYATVELLPDLREHTLGHGTIHRAQNEFDLARGFCDWLDDHSIAPAHLRQADLDRWYATRGTDRGTATRIRRFLRFAMRDGTLPRLRLPALPAGDLATTPITEQQRLTLIARLTSDVDAPLRVRVAGLLVLLFAQPVSRIIRLTRDDVIISEDDGTIQLRLGEPPVPVPGPFAGFLMRHAASPDGAHAAVPVASRWLFPGQNAGRPLSTSILSRQLTEYGIPISAARSAAFRRIVQQAPAPVVAQALGYSTAAALNNSSAAGHTWSRYAAGDHSR